MYEEYAKNICRELLPNYNKIWYNKYIGDCGGGVL
jgi:hypothetical protein